jgi:ABC-2 type transport system ATP-binding protein
MELTLERLSKRYQEKWAVRDFSIDFEPGVYGLLGPNGSGKSTLMRMLVDVLKPTGGRILLDGRDISLMGDEYRDKLGYLPQNFGVYKNFTAHRFLLYLAALKGIERKKAECKIDELLTFVNLKDMKNKKIKTFSGGMKQRLGIAQALLNDPHILMLDEPTAGLDPNERIRFRNLISEISSDRIILLSTHIVSDVEYIAKDIVVMKKGVLLQAAPSAALVKEMDGKVWRVHIQESDLLGLKQHHVIGNILRQSDGLDVRVISEQLPFPDAVQVKPGLEDYYLYHFGEEAKVDGTAEA